MTFTIPAASKNKEISVEFDGVYRCSEVWINGHLLGYRPNGYISFQYNITPYLKFGEANVMVVKVDNSKQINSRWYSGSGIYRNVRLVTTNNIAVSHWGTFVTTPKVSDAEATIAVKAFVSNASGKSANISINNILLDNNGKEVARNTKSNIQLSDAKIEVADELILKNPSLWSIEKPRKLQAVGIRSLALTSHPAILWGNP